ncbi:MAG TPA: ABC transporter permease [Solirubrobacterales bacterium]|jgi:ABC-type nitrate/sulfonate/bicarbonate transport system permease component
MSALRRYAAPLAVILVLLGAWEVAARWDLLSNALNIQDFLVPAPSDIAKSLWDDRSLLGSNAWVTLKEVLLGFGIAAAAGIGFAFLIHLSDTARRAIYPLLIGSQTIPIVILAPILVVWFGFGLTPKLVIVALICFFPITVNTLDGLRSVDPEMTKMMRALGAGRFQRLWRVEAPASLPYAFSGAKVAVSVSVIGAVFAEYVGSSSGLGHLINQAQAQLLTARSFAAVVVLSAMAIGLFGLVSAIERRVITWDSRGVMRS